MEIVDYPHPPLNEEITAIGGRFLFLKEERLALEVGEVLYHVGCAVADTSCCGPGAGVAFVRVAGRIHAYKNRLDEGGRPVSRVVPIREAALQAAVRRAVAAREHVRQVDFF